MCGSHVFTCVVVYSEAFDKVNYWKLLCQMTDDDNFGYVAGKIIGILVLLSVTLCSLAMVLLR